jgi:hypothetical protein
MPRGLDSAILDEFASTTFGLPIYCVRITRKDASKLRWAERSITFDDGAAPTSPITTHAYEARLKSLSGLDVAPDQAGPITIVVSNVDGAVTTLDRDVTFRGALFEVLAYLPNIDRFVKVWSGWGDEVSEISHETATLIAYPTIFIPNIQVPKRSIGLPCSNVFGNTANWNSALDFEGSECPYQRVSTIGFFCGLVGDIDDSVTSITVYWGTTAPGMGAKFQKNDRIKLLNEIMLITEQPADPDGGFMQTLTVQRGYMDTVAASHTDNTPTYFNNCGFAVADCTRRGMYGNNTADSYTV